ncbi:MAG: GtrA family protein [Nitrososphaerota archaeon]|nr:GtrA family protein [Nitrososphaerota archaeon]
MEKIKDLNNKYGIFKTAEFGIAGEVGFLVAEALILFGLYALYGKANVSSSLSSSPTLIALNIFAFVIGVTVGFFVNEKTTVRSIAKEEKKGIKSTMIRLGKFQGVYALGNAITIGVQLALLAVIALSPAIGNVIGAIAAFPVSYFISMRVVWKPSEVRTF